jgi:ABC-type nitrate/sulfonate/bicarbonate transport system substrate-binding protein
LSIDFDWKLAGVRRDGYTHAAMPSIRLALLRGVCQLPAYVAHVRGLFAARDLESRVEVTPTAWLIPEQLANGTADFAVMPWTRVAASASGEAPLKVVCGSGHEEAAVVVRHGLDVGDVRSVAIPREGGIKDLTAMRLLDSLGWTRDRVEHRRFPSGDGAIICLVGQGADAASMIEPYATMMEHLGIGRIVRRTGDVWPGAPGCSLAASAALIERAPDVVQRVVDAYVEATAFVDEHLDEAAAIGAPFIGVHATIVRRALHANRPQVDAIRNGAAMRRILEFMRELGYVRDLPRDFADLRFLDGAQDVRSRA